MIRPCVKLIFFSLLAFIISCNSEREPRTVEEILILSAKAEHSFWVHSMKSDYSQESLHDLESWFENLDEESQIDFSQSVGAYFGECMVKKYNGTWELLDGVWAVKFKEGSYAFPFNKIEKFITNGSEDSFYSMYISVDKVISQ